jgi:PTS system mannose-specific IIC component
MSTFLLAFILAAVVGAWVMIGMLSTSTWAPLVLACLAGAIVGDMQLGLQVGATCALMSLGFYTYGGATIPDYNVGALFGVFVAHQSGDINQGIFIGSIIALLMAWFDILGRAGTISWFLGRFIPVFIGMMFLDKYLVIQHFVENYAWVKNGLGVIGSSLPAVGFALLLSYMDIKRYWPYMIAGYVLFAYMHVPTIGLALVGVAAAGLNMKTQKEKLATA